MASGTSGGVKQQMQSAKAVKGFIKDGSVRIIGLETYNFTDVTITSGNTLLLCNYTSRCPKVYAYKNCKDYEKEAKFSSGPWGIALLPGSDIAAVTLPQEESLQFLDTTNMVRKNKVQLTFRCESVITVKDMIIMGDDKGNVHILDTQGALQKTLFVGLLQDVYRLHYYKDADHILCRLGDELRCIDLQGNLIRKRKIPDGSAMTVDHQGNAYIAGLFTNEVMKYSPKGIFLNKVLEKYDGLDHPVALSFNNDYTILFVINNNDDFVSTAALKFSCKY